MMKCQETVLVIDDEVSIRRFIENCLVAEGKRVLLASTAKAGLEYLRSCDVNIVFTELQLPDEDGISVLRKALQIHPNIASVVITGFGTLESAIEAMRLGACDYITKPFNRQQVCKSLQRAINNIKLSTFPKWQKSAALPVEKLTNKSFIANSRPMREVVTQAKKFSKMDIPVLIQGENGVGKKTIARLIHSHSPFADDPYTHINCSIIESTERFNKHGVGVLERLLQSDSLESTQKSTLFLEDIDQLPKLEQQQLLLMMEEGWIRAPWSPVSKPNSIRLIASTTVDLKAEVDRDRFHRSLYDNLNILPVNVPPLRERGEDIVSLAVQILEQLCKIWSCDYTEIRYQISKEVWEMLLDYFWPGNIQELVSVLSRVLLTGDSSEVTKLLVQSHHPGQQTETIFVPVLGDLKLMERHMINEVVKRCGGNKAEAARTLGMHRRTLYRMLYTESENTESCQTIGLEQ